MEQVEDRLKTFTAQLQTEFGILDRLLYKHKNQHRRSSYFRYLLKVRRDLKLLKSTNLEEIFEASLVVISGNRPKQKVQFLESLKRRKCSGGKYNFLERLLGVARLLSEIVEPLLKAAMEISTLLARSFFMKFSLTVLAVLARIRVLVQQMLLDVVQLYNTVTSLSQRAQTIKLNQEGFEVFREYYPRKEKDGVILECVWQTDKYVLIEKSFESETDSQMKDDEGAVVINASNIQYENIEILLGADEVGAEGAKHGLMDPVSAEKSDSNAGPNTGEEHAGNSPYVTGQLEAVLVSSEDHHTESLARLNSETKNNESMEEDLCRIAKTPDGTITSTEPGWCTSSSAPLPPRPSNVRSTAKKKVAFVPVKPPAPPSAAKDSGSLGKDKVDKSQGERKDPFFDLLTGANKNGNLF